VVLVYSRLLYDREALARVDYLEHLRQLLQLETDRACRLAARRVVLLDARAETLAKRCAGKFQSVPDVDFLDGLRIRFTEVFGQLPNVERVATDAALDEVIDRISVILQRPPVQERS
jgi:hypothetical protein